jgi:hypothetical protein
VNDTAARPDQPGKVAGPARRHSEPAVCALPGCAAAFSQVPGGQPRQYCGPAHRIAARRLSVQEAVRAAAGRPGTGAAAGRERHGPAGRRTRTPAARPVPGGWR